MASESTDEEALTVSLPADLDDWLGERADSLGVDREAVLLQLLSSYRAAAELDDDLTSPAALGEELDRQVESQLQDRVEDAVQSALAERLDTRIEAAMQSKATALVEEAASEQLSNATGRVRQQVGERVDAVESKHDEDIEDIRSRVVQLKRELDGKAPASHDHEAFERITGLAAELSELETRVAEIEEDVSGTVEEHDVAIDDIDERLESLQDRLKTVAWVVSDLRDAHESQGGLEAVERIKRAAAKNDIDRAKCENCGNGVALALLTEPECPHCEATVTNVEAASGFFGKPRLLTASQLESGASNE